MRLSARCPARRAVGHGGRGSCDALFGLGAATAAAFWFLDVLMKGHQLRYYSQMRDTEVAAYELNAVELGNLGEVSSPRIDMSWGVRGEKGKPDWRTDRPERRTGTDPRPTAGSVRSAERHVSARGSSALGGDTVLRCREPLVGTAAPETVRAATRPDCRMLHSRWRGNSASFEIWRCGGGERVTALLLPRCGSRAGEDRQPRSQCDVALRRPAP